MKKDAKKVAAKPMTVKNNRSSKTSEPKNEDMKTTKVKDPKKKY